MKHYLLLLSALIGANIAGLLLYHSIVIDHVYHWQTVQEESALARAETNLETRITALVADSTNDEITQDAALEIADALGFDVAWYLYTDTDIPQEYIVEKAAASGGTLFSSDYGILVYLDEQYAFEFYPPGASSIQYSLSENIEWLLSALLCIIVVTIFQRRQNSAIEHLALRLEQLAAAPGDSASEPQAKDPLARAGVIADKLMGLRAAELAIHEQHMTAQRDLLHGVAHELRSPMARVEFALELLMDAEVEDRPMLRAKVNTALEDLDGLVKEILSYSRLQHGKTELTVTSIDLHKTLRAAIDTVAPVYPEIKFTLEAAASETLLGDETLFKRAIINLLRNAGRFAVTQCHVTLTANNSMLAIAIDDDGVGIPPGKRERVFEPFTRLDPSRSRDSGGCGLGLAIVGSIIAKHKGQVSIEDSPLGGASFVIQLPQ